MVYKKNIFVCKHLADNLYEQEDKTPWHLLTECPNPLVHNKLPPDHWEVNPLLNLINKLKFLEVPDYSDTHY